MYSPIVKPRSRDPATTPNTGRQLSDPSRACEEKNERIASGPMAKYEGANTTPSFVTVFENACAVPIRYPRSANALSAPMTRAVASASAFDNDRMGGVNMSADNVGSSA